jgi:hypothetical protein
MTNAETELHPYDVRDPAALIEDIAERVPLALGTAHMALVQDVSTDQTVLRIDTLRLPAEILDWHAAREELRRVVDAWPIPMGPCRPRHTPVLVVVRPGLCVFGPNELIWFTAERYANFLKRLWTVNDILVTEHGWLDFMTKEAGTSPAALPAPSQPASGQGSHE